MECSGKDIGLWPNLTVPLTQDQDTSHSGSLWVLASLSSGSENFCLVFLSRSMLGSNKIQIWPS